MHAELGIRTVAVHAEDDAASLHARMADDVRPLVGTGVGAYLDRAQLLDVAKAAGCDAVHPGYGFLSEDVSFSRAHAVRCPDPVDRPVVAVQPGMPAAWRTVELGAAPPSTTPMSRGSSRRHPGVAGNSR